AVPEVEAVPEPAPVVAAAPVRPGAPMPSPAMLAARHGAPSAAAFGRVDESGVVYVKTGDGEREVGSYPGVSPREALAYFGRKYDDLSAQVDLLLQRVTHTEMAAKEADEAHSKLVALSTEPNVVGDLAELSAKVARIGDAVRARPAAEATARAAARAAATTAREELVAEAERIAAQPEERVQWKTSGERMRELLDAWKSHQRSGPRIDKETEAALWHRFGAARNSFDKARRVHFAHLDEFRGDAKLAKERITTEAEKLATSRDWPATASEFKRLMDRWRQAGRAGRSDDDALWARFKAAQDSFFEAKDALVAAEDEVFRASLAVKDGLLAEAEAILPVTDLEAAKAALRSIQDRWDKAGKVPRADMDRTERSLKRVEQAVRDIEEKRWASSNPEAAARARSLVDQLETAVAGLERELAAAQASGNTAKVATAQAALDARRQWLEQARAGLAEFGG
ncbi:MAG TPA: DUF349 domain-containing protein, partial [Candidatus Lustribacter sp.]|nr:DUF349 domain-containing protein [Candidatus Lustribacter sp.]